MFRSKAMFLSLFLALLSVTFVSAQSEVILKLAIPEFVLTMPSTRQIIERFEEEHPGILVELVSDGNRIVSPPASSDDVNRFLGDVSRAMSLGDVVAVNSDWLLPEATQAGYMLDLTPLVIEDSTLNPDDFYPPAWEAFQWDAGTWALPTSYDLFLILYDQSAFDEANLSYPDGSWTLAQLEEAAHQLTQEDLPGLFLEDRAKFGMLLRGLLSTGLYDANAVPSVPEFSDPELVSVLETLAQMETDGVMVIRDMLGNYVEAPMRIRDIRFALFSPDNQLRLALLPGNSAGLSVRGFAVSRGTQYPEAAYELARYLSMQPDLVDGGTNPARLDQPSIFFGDVSDEMAAVLDAARENALSPSELRFTSYLLTALNSEDIPAALQATEADIITRLETAYANRDDVRIEIPLPRPHPTLAPNEIVLDFGVFAHLTPLPTRYSWEQLATEFADTDPQVGLVNLEVTSSGNLQSMSEIYDCFYMPHNVIPAAGLYSFLPSAELSLLRNIDPLLEADPAFDEADFVGNVMMQVTRDNHVWALPMTLIPEVMWYKPVDFENARLPFPEGSWTISDFTTALDALADEHSPVITPYHMAMDDTPLLLLIAAYGGLPIDYRTDPPTLNFTDAETINAIRQVLDLAKAEQLNYLGLTRASRSGSGVPPLILSPLDDANVRENTLVTMVGQGSYELMTYPIGTEYTPVAYDVGAGYISANAEDVEACYRFLTLVAGHMELFSGMPVRFSQIASPEVEATRGAETVAFYTAFAELLEQPTTVEFPSSYIFPLHHRWLDRAFDRYVLDDAHLEAELADAETLTLAYFECLESSDGTGTVSPILECAQSIDPTVLNFP